MDSAQLIDAALFAAIPRYGDLAIHAVIDLRRRLERTELERALAATIADFPVLGRRYRPGFWRDRWVPVESPVSSAVHVDAGDLEARTEHWLRHDLAPTVERPIRVVALPRERGTRLILSVLHLAVDGAGVAAVGHVFGSHLYGVAPSLPVDRRRDVWSVLERLRWFHLPVLIRDLGATALQPLRHLSAAPRLRDYPASGDRATCWRHVLITADQLAEVRGRLPPRTSVNDLLVAVFARVAATRSERRSVVVTYTMDLRRYGRTARLIAANSSSILSAVVRREDTRDLPRAAAAVSALTSAQRRGLAGPAFVLGPQLLAAAVPHAITRSLVGAVSPVIVELPLRHGLILTNVGRIDDGVRAFGDDIAALRIVGPNVRGLSIPLVVAFGFRGDLHLELFGAPGLGAGALQEMEREIYAALELDRAPVG